MARIDHVELKLDVLRELRDLFHRAACAREALNFELILAAVTLGVAVEDLQGTIAELMKLGYVRPTSTAEHLAIAQGECEITKEGLMYLHLYETAHHVPRETRQRSAVGFSPDGDVAS